MNQSLESVPSFQIPSAMLRALPIVAKTVPSKTYVPILSHVLLTGDGAMMRVESTDLEIRSLFACEYAGPSFAVTLPAKDVAAFVKGHADMRLRIEGDRAFLTVFAGASRSFPTLPASEYPVPPVLGDDLAYIAGDARSIVESYLRAASVASSEELRGAVLMGTYVEFGAQPITIGEKAARTIYTATDGYKMVTVTQPAGIGTASVIAPALFARALKNLGKLPKGAKGTLMAHKRLNEYISFSSAGFTVISRCVDGTYPNYRQVIPPIGQEGRFGVNAPQLVSAVVGATHAANDRAAMVKLDRDTSRARLTVSASSDESGSFSADVTISPYGMEKNDFPAFFNGKYLAGLLDLFDGDVTFQQSDKLKPALVYDALRDTVAVLMGLRGPEK